VAHTTIHVTLIDGATGRILGRSDLPIHQLPDSFEMPTTLHLGNQDWHVETAEPMRADEFSRTGALILTLRQVSHVDPNKILFTLPTLDAVIPHPDQRIKAPGHRTLELHEDDWRQIEFVSTKYQREIEAELADIATICREYGVDNGRFPGFREIHMRKRIPSPFDPPLAVAEMWAALGVTGPSFDAVSFERTSGIVPESFAFHIGELTMYGTSVTNSVRCLCLCRHRSALREPALSGVQRLMSAHSLYLVDWCRMTLLAPSDTKSLALYFSGQ